MKKGIKVLLWTGAAGLLIAGIAAAFWIKHFRTYTPASVALDLRAAAGVHHAAQPVDRFLELRYGPLSDPANRQKAFLGFFDLGHMEGMYIIVNHMKGEEKQKNIAATARWIANYRNSMTPAEKQALGAYVNSDAGRAQLRQATAQYMSKEVTYRAATSPVITELLTTVGSLPKQ